MADRRAKDALFDGFARVAKALGSGRRAELVDVLAQGERHVEELAAEIGQSVANTSHHLQALSAVGLVATRRDKTRIYYRLASEEVERLWTALQSVAELHLDELDGLTADYVGNRGALEEISREELARRLAVGEIAVIDVRPEAEYTAGHIPGARSVPLARLPEAMRDLPADVEVVAYCRGPYCVLADDAVRFLRRRRRRARRLQDGFPEWRADDLPTVAGVAS